MSENINERNDEELKKEAEKFEKEAMYLVTMNHVKKMYKDGIIKKDEFDRMNKIFIEKYNPGLPVSADED